MSSSLSIPEQDFSPGGQVLQARWLILLLKGPPARAQFAATLQIHVSAAIEVHPLDWTLSGLEPATIGSSNGAII